MDSRDLALIRRVLDGDTDAFAGLVAGHSRAIYGLAFRITGNAATAEDAVQETFLRAFRFLARFDQRAELGTWLHRIAVNAAIDQTRRLRRERFARVELPPEGDLSLAEIPSGEAGPERRALAAEICRRTELALAGLSPSERAAFVLRHYEGRSPFVQHPEPFHEETCHATHEASLTLGPACRAVCRDLLSRRAESDGGGLFGALFAPLRLPRRR